jgi:hypothetical protein
MAALVLAALLAPVRTASGEPTPADADGGIVEDTPPVNSTLATDRPSYPPGQAVRLILSVRNGGATPATLRFSSGQRCDFAVLDDRGRRLWQWSDDRMFTQSLGSMTLQPGETRSFEATWDQRTNQGAPVLPGQYHASGWLTTVGPRQMAGAEVRLVAGTFNLMQPAGGRLPGLPGQSR